MSPRKAGRQALTSDQIVTAALELIDETGLDGHSMRTLGTRLGVDASTLYYHLPSKDALHSLIVDKIMSGLDLSSDDPSASTEDRLMAAATELRRSLLVHPRALPLVAGRSMRTPVQLAGVEIMVGILFEAGFSAIEALLALDAIGQSVIGLTTIHALHDERAAEGADDGGLPDLSAETFPHLHRLFAEGDYLGSDAEFAATVHALITGLLASQRAGTLTA
jgi:Transcriptional regulator